LKTGLFLLATESVLTRLAERASALEQKWFIRLLLKSMNLGLVNHKIFNTLHPKAREVFQRCNNLEKTCILIADKKLDEHILNVIVQPFQHIMPMLCERFPGKFEDVLASDVMFAELKMDGERFHIHFENNQFKYFSRNGIEYTNSFGGNFEEGSYTPLLKAIWPIGLKSVILDGEMMVWDAEKQRVCEKSENTDVKHLKRYTNWRPLFVVYDILYLNGQSLLNLNYSQRRFKVDELIKEMPTILEVIKSQKILSLQHFLELFQDALKQNAEGIILKKQNSLYLPGTRNKGGWYKEKPDVSFTFFFFVSFKYV